MTQASQQIARQYMEGALNKKNWGAVAYNVLVEGLVGDGVTDDTAALQALINKAIAEGRKTLLFPHGKYYVTALTNADKVDFVGDNSSFVGGYSGSIGDLGGFASLKADYMYLGAASSYGVDPSIGTKDATALLNAYFAALKAKGIKYAFFDKPHTYNVSGKLTGARDLILIGNDAHIKSKLLDNYFIQIMNSGETYAGKFNTKVSDSNMFSALLTAISNGTANVCVMGDSLTTGGDDSLGVKYGNSVTFRENSPEGLTKFDAYYQRLMDMMATKFKDATFNFYNRGVVGTAISQWDSNQTFNSTSKTWIEHVKDTNADVLIIAFGMNNYGISTGKAFAYYMDQITNYIASNFTKQPSIVWMTTPRPMMALESGWGAYDAQFARDVAAYSARTHGKSKGHYIIDVGRVADLKRTGQTYDNPIMQTIAADETAVDKIATGTFVKSGSEYTITTDGSNGQYIQFDVSLRDFVFEFDLKCKNGVTNVNEALWFAFNQFGQFSSTESAALIKPKPVSGKGTVEVYNNYIDSAHWGQSGFFADTVAWDDGVYRTFKVEKRDDILNISIDGKQVYRGRSKINNLPGKIGFNNNNSAATVYTFKNFKIYGGAYRQYLPTLTERDMWGLYNEPGAKDHSIGGNGLNHPSTIGLQETYCVALQEFVDDVANTKRPTIFTQTLSRDLSVAGTQEIALPVGIKRIAVIRAFAAVPSTKKVVYNAVNYRATGMSGSSCLYNHANDSAQPLMGQQLMRFSDSAGNDTYAFFANGAFDEANNKVTLTWAKQGTGATGIANITLEIQGEV